MWQKLLLLSFVVDNLLLLPLNAQLSANGTESNSTLLGTVVSRNKPATQSSPYSWTYQGTLIPILPSNANDGNYDTIWGKTPGKYCSHTRLNINPWWQVDLLDEFYITQVKIWNREDCCADRLLPLKIEVSSNGSSWTQCAYVNGTGEAGKVYTIPCVATGRFVRITDEKITVLTLCEVEVYGNRVCQHRTQCESHAVASTGASCPNGLVQWTVRDNINMAGSDIKSVPKQNVVSCQQQCLATKGCVATVWNKQSSDCWLKNALSATSSNNIGVTSTFSCCCKGLQ